ncbi:MAG: FimV/HubP family polar landmark protein [Woeseiaceae bacterium]|jgi:pilus assembly protein FimV
MSRRLSRISLVFVLLLSSEVWALGLGDIRMESALNEPLSARIELLSATPEELDNLTVAMASGDTFARYGIDRPYYLQDIEFQIIRSGRADGNYVQVRSATPMAEPFLTFLVEASWSRGRLLREYTVFLDPPTFAPPAADTAPAVQAPTRTAPSDSGRIERTAPPPQPQPQPRPAPAPAPRQADTTPAAQSEPQQPAPAAADFSDIPGGDYTVLRGDTLWGLASRIRPDFRLTMNQTMLAVFEANPNAFGGNINILRAGASIRIPSADEIFQINRDDALAEAQRQHAEWGGGTYAAASDTSTRPSLTLVPPDDDFADEGDTLAPEPEPEPYEEPEPFVEDEPLGREQEILDRIAELEAADVPQQQSLIEIRDNELAQLREELARIRGEEFEPAVADDLADETGDIIGDDAVADAADDAAVDDVEPAEVTPQTTIQSAPAEPGLVDKVLEFVKSWWMPIAGALVVVIGLLFWMMRRGGSEDDIEDWQPLDKDEMVADISATESLRAPSPDESIVVVEQESEPSIGSLDETVDAPAPSVDLDATGEVHAVPEPAPFADASTEETGQFGSLEDTFSSETAVNLDQSDPIAEADFHMAYGLYDQAADLINGALQLEPERSDLLTKLCEIYFVWGNRDAFIDAASRLKSAVGGDDSADWDKIVIMGQQIAADDELFAGASAAGATKAVDLAFDEGGDETGALDMEFGVEEGASDVVDLGGGDDEVIDLGAEDESALDFSLDVTGEQESVLADVDETAESPTVESPDLDLTGEMPASDETAEMPVADETAAASDETAETPTIEQQFDSLSGTAELPSLDDTLGNAIESSGQSADETAEINLDDLGLDVDSLAETELASLDDDVDATGLMEAIDETDISEVTGKNPEVDADATGLQEALSPEEDTGINESLSGTGIHEKPEDALLDATGVTQVLSSDLAVDTTTDAEADIEAEEKTMLATGLDDEPPGEDIADDAETLLASLDDDDDAADFDFAKTEALPKDAFTGDFNMDETGEMPAVASTDVELDLDDLTAALQVSDAGDTVEQPRDDATVEQPRPSMPDDSPTANISPEDMSDELTEARTMTEVGTKLDLARAYVDMGDPAGARSILEEVLDEGDEGQRQQAQQLLDSLPS